MATLNFNIIFLEEKECLLLDDYNTRAINLDTAEDSASDLEDESLACTDDENSSTSTDIDIVVEEYKEGLKVRQILVYC